MDTLARRWARGGPGDRQLACGCSAPARLNTQRAPRSGGESGDAGKVGTAVVAEILADKIPVVDHFLDGVGLFVKPVAGTLVLASTLSGTSPLAATVLGLILGAPAACSALSCLSPLWASSSSSLP